MPDKNMRGVSVWIVRCFGLTVHELEKLCYLSAGLKGGWGVNGVETMFGDRRERAGLRGAHAESGRASTVCLVLAEIVYEDMRRR